SDVSLQPNAQQLQGTNADGRVRPGGDVARYSTRGQRPPSPIFNANESRVLRAPFRLAGELSQNRWSADFHAKSGEEYWIEVQSQSCDQVTDIELILFELTEHNGKPIPKRLTQQDDPRGIQGVDVRSFSRDPYLRWTPARDGRYRIQLIDHMQSSDRSEAKEFRLEVRRPAPQFHLLAFPAHPGTNAVDAKPTGLTLMQNGTQAIQVRVLRQDGFNEAIEIFAESSSPELTQSFSHSRAVLAKGQTECTLVLSHAPKEEAEPEKNDSTEPISLRIYGRAIVDGNSIARNSGSDTEATYACVHQSKSAERTRPQSRITSQLPLYVNVSDRVPVRFALQSETSVEVEQGKSCELPILVNRLESSKVTAIARAKDLPPKTTCADVTIGADVDEAKATIKVAKDTPVGEYTVWMQCETKLNWSRNPQALQRLEDSLAESETTLKEAKESGADPAKVKQLEMFVAQVKDAVNQQRKSSSAKPLTVWIPSTSCTIRVVKTASSK
ncbi:MAG: hypothetical protein AAGG44_16350, partial [Planctomycetota bacterium]